MIYSIIYFMKEILKKLILKEDLTHFEIQNTIRLIAANEATDSQIGAFLIGLTNKGVNREEVFSLASTMREFSIRVKSDKYIVDSCGTGADFSKSINISTASAIVANACGASVIKQTNSSITSECGSTDLLSTLGLEITRTPEAALEGFNKNGITFVHSPYFNDFAKINNPIRQQIGIKTVFNYLGPLINPSFPDAQLLGVSSFEMCEKLAFALQKLNTDRALVVNGIEPNLDEVSLCSKTKVFELENGEVSEYYLSPEDFGLETVGINELRGGSAVDNARIIEDVFAGKEKGAKFDVISLNAGAMIYLAGLKPSIFEGFELAKEAISGGLVHDKLQGLKNGLFKTF